MNQLSSSKFPSSCKCANITPIVKDQTRNCKNNYTPVLILSVFSKIFQKSMNNKLSIYFENISKFQCGFRKGFSRQHCLILMTENWKSATNNSKVYTNNSTDLTFGCNCHILLITKLSVHGLSLSALKLMHNYLQKHKQVTKNAIAYSLWEEIVPEIPQGSILGPLLF